MSNEEAENELRAQLVNLANGALHRGVSAGAVMRAFASAYYSLGLTFIESREDFAERLHREAAQVAAGNDPVTPRGEKH